MSIILFPEEKFSQLSPAPSLSLDPMLKRPAPSNLHV